MAMRLIDLSHAIEAGMTTYPGLPGPSVEPYLTREASRAVYRGEAEFDIATVSFVVNTGTYIDAPFHRFAEGADVAELPLERLVDVPGIVVDVPREGRAIDAAQLRPFALRGCAVLLRTGWSSRWGTPEYGDASHPFLTADGAAFLAEAQPALVGIDALNLDDMADFRRPAHTALLAAEIPIVEHLCRLDQLPPGGFRVTAVPAPFRGVGTFPVRVVARLDDPR